MTRELERCLFALAADIPPDHKGRRYCRCGVIQDHPRHTLTSHPDAAELDRRRLGESEDR